MFQAHHGLRRATWRLKRLAPPLMVTFVLLTGSSLPSAATLPPIPDLASFHWQALSTPHRDRLRQAYKKALASPDDGTAVGQLGIVLQAFEEFQLAATCFERSSQLEPRAFRWIYYLGIVEAAQGEKSKALDALARAVQMAPAYLPARLKLADAWLATGNLEESQRAYGRAMRQFPDSAPAYYGVARIQASNKQYGAAITNLNKACALFPDYGAAYYSLGIIYRDQGKLADAQKSLAMFELHRNSSPRVPDPDGQRG